MARKPGQFETENLKIPPKKKSDDPFRIIAVHPGEGWAWPQVVNALKGLEALSTEPTRIVSPGKECVAAIIHHVKKRGMPRSLRGGVMVVFDRHDQSGTAQVISPKGIKPRAGSIFRNGEWVIVLRVPDAPSHDPVPLDQWNADGDPET